MWIHYWELKFILSLDSDCPCVFFFYELDSFEEHWLVIL